MFLILIISLYTTRVVLNVLGETDYGVYNVVAGFVALFSFINSSMTIGIQRFYNYEIGSNNGKKLNDIFNSAIQLQIITGIIILIISETIGIWYLNNIMVIPQQSILAANIVFQCSIISLVLVVLQVPYSSAILASEKMDVYAYISIVDAVLKLSFAFTLQFLSSDQLIFYGFLTLTVSFIDLLLYIKYSYSHFTFCSIKWKFKRNLFMKLFSFSGWNSLDMLSYSIKSQGINLLLNYFFGPIVNAAKGISAQIQTAIQGLSSNLIVAFRPQLVESFAKGEISKTVGFMYGMSKLSILLLSMIILPVVIKIDEILHIWLGNEIPEYTQIFTILILFDMLISSMNTPVSQVAVATGKIKVYELIRAIIIIMVIPMSLIFFILNYPAYYAFIVSILISIIHQFISLIILTKIISFSLFQYTKEVIIPCSIFLVVIPIVPLIVNYVTGGILGLLLVTLTSIISVSVFGFILLLTSKEKKYVMSKVFNIFNKNIGE